MIGYPPQNHPAGYILPLKIIPGMKFTRENVSDRMNNNYPPL